MPYLLFEDTRNNKNYPVTQKQNVAENGHLVFISYHVKSDEPGVYECSAPKQMDAVRVVAERLGKNKDQIEELTILPGNKDVPLSYLEKVKQLLTEKNLSCVIKNEVPDLSHK
ncbi:MAG: hypothetical protein LUD46_02425 [Parabacteroides sp.]|nr:hypothetical protein [Parabacteroides sp.]